MFGRKRVPRHTCQWSSQSTTLSLSVLRKTFVLITQGRDILPSWQQRGWNYIRGSKESSASKNKGQFVMIVCECGWRWLTRTFWCRTSGVVWKWSFQSFMPSLKWNFSSVCLDSLMWFDTCIVTSCFQIASVVLAKQRPDNQNQSVKIVL